MSYMEYTNGMTTPKEHLGRVLRRVRKARGLRQEDIAAALDVSVKQVGRWEKGENAPSSLTLMRLFRFLRQQADAPDLQEIAAIIEELPPPGDLDVRIKELSHRIRSEPWLADRIDRLLSLTVEEYQAAMKYLDHRRNDRQSSP